MCVARATILRGVCLRYPKYHYKTPQQQTPKTHTRNSTLRRGVCLCSHEYLHNTTVGRLQRPTPRTPHSEPRREPAQSAIIGLRTCWSEALHFHSSPSVVPSGLSSSGDLIEILTCCLRCAYILLTCFLRSLVCPSRAQGLSDPSPS